ncbi:probable transcription factor At5g28040 [Rhodamnia argentea]|uniref:Probable transcription factor At5g28040 n=1 Tax=Rhodamnia argentea TaxID=178133 RepID=A0ABM3H3D3_9MYRT|nr:probable transcription factor At5g28040 [Rhodamnia argentea]XP_048131116.1 probable transcription factor At5g28040 [Rhodamnia argentea]
MDSSTPPPPLEPPSKLPIKRKNPNPSSSLTTTTTTTTTTDHHHLPDVAAVSPPSKFHRIWSEPDEIRFLQCLLDCASSQNLSFPRDLRVFYRRFSASSASSQPYSNSQLYEKLRGLRKKFRAVSSRLDRGALDPSRLSPHDRALFDLSEKLWSPKYASVSPFGTGNSNGSNNANRGFASGGGDVMPDDGLGLVGVRVSFAAELHLGSKGWDETGRGMIGCSEEEEEEEEEGEEYYVADGLHGNANGADAVRGDCHGDLKMKEVNVDCDFDGRENGVEILNETSGLGGGGGGGGIGELVKRAALDVFDQSLEEVKAGFSQERLHCYCRCSCLSDDSSFAAFKDRPGSLQDQRSAELDVFGRRLRLIIEEVLTRK